MTKREKADELEERARKLRAEARADDLAEGRKRPLVDRLRYAATVRCHCGAGMAYDPFGPTGGLDAEGNQTPHGRWECSGLLLKTAIPPGEVDSVQHTRALSFRYYDVTSEYQPSARGQTTRPQASASASASEARA
ncbi:MAG TPA: hypothetical protein VNH45_11200 [Gaiellaceae bacterium]|nr:hypothetical protein [Gaiellaceae bacterium]